MFESYHRELLNFIARLTGDRDRAADVVQESYARALAMQARSQPAEPGTDIQDPRALLYRIAKNLVVDQHRRGQVRDHEALDHPETEHISAPLSAQPEQRLDQQQSAQRLLATIDGLPPRCKEAFILYKLEGMPQADIAEQMGISRNAVEKHIIAGMVACRRCLQDALLDS